MRVTLIAAVAENGVIGRGNGLPWHLPADLQRFKRLTTGHTIVMGRKTYQSIGKPLPHRRSIVISQSPDFHPEGVTVVAGMPQALDLAREASDVFVIGGRRVFEAALPLADRLELTRVHAEVPGDVMLPPINLTDWRLVSEKRHPSDDRHAYPFSFLTYQRQPGV